MWCGHAYILALPLGQCPFMDTARKVAGTPLAPNNALNIYKYANDAKY